MPVVRVKLDISSYETNIAVSLFEKVPESCFSKFRDLKRCNRVWSLLSLMSVKAYVFEKWNCGLRTAIFFHIENIHKLYT